MMIYDKEFHEDEEQNKDLIIEVFQNAIEEQSVIVLLQPKFSATENRVKGAEALARIEDENGDLISPMLFIPILEERDMVTELDLEVVRQVAELQGKWQKEGRPLLPISVNLSRRDFYRENFVEKLDSLVKEQGIPRSCIEFELTETAVVENIEVIVGAMHELRKMGYRISLDDFGTGYSSLYMLNKIPADVIKFDRSFVLYSIQNETGRTILKNLISTFKEVNFEVVCEGVETKKERDAIVSCGCTIIQGFLYDHPLEIAAYERKYMKK